MNRIKVPGPEFVAVIVIVGFVVFCAYLFGRSEVRYAIAGFHRMANDLKFREMMMQDFRRDWLKLLGFGLAMLACVITIVVVLFRGIRRNRESE